jgi:hypothetical protein
VSFWRPAFALALLAASAPALAGAVASNFKKETRGAENKWNAGSAFDGKPDTAWMVPGDSENKGETITFDVPRAALDKLAINPGFDSDEDTFLDYSRVKTLKVEVLEYDDTNTLKPIGNPQTVEVKDARGLQIIELDDIVGTSNGGGKVKLTVMDVHAGRDFPNFAVSELLLYLKEFDAAPKVTVDGAPADKLTDDSPKTVWTGPTTTTFTVQSAGFSVSSVGFTAPTKDYARPKKVELKAGGRVQVAELPDFQGTHWVFAPATFGYTGSAWGEVEIKVLEVWPGKKFADQLGLTELDVRATNSDGL